MKNKLEMSNNKPKQELEGANLEKADEAELAARVAKQITEDFFHHQVENLGRHFDAILKNFPEASGVRSAKERNPDLAAYIKTISLLPNAVKWQINIKGMAVPKDIGTYRQYLEKLTVDVNESIKLMGGVKMVETPKLEAEEMK